MEIKLTMPDLVCITKMAECIIALGILDREIIEDSLFDISMEQGLPHIYI